jgi:hypothetical protein
MKILPVGAELFHADRLTDMAKRTVAFGNSAKGPKKHSRQYSACGLSMFYTVVPSL